MQPNKVQHRLGRYAIYFRSLSDTMRQHRKVLFGQKAKTPVLDAAQIAPAEEAEVSQGASEQTKADKKLKSKVSEIEKLQDKVETSQDNLIKSKAVFPFDLFPDTIAIDRHKLTIVHRTFFFEQNTISVQLKDVKNVEANLGPFLGSLVITSQHFKNNVQHINYLPRRDAIEIQHLLQGVIVAFNEKIDISEVKSEEIRSMLKKLGEGEVREHPAEAVGDLSEDK